MSVEQKEDLQALLEHPGAKALFALMDAELEAIQSEVLRFDLGAGDERALVRLKCRAEGAAKLASNLRARLAHKPAVVKSK